MPRAAAGPRLQLLGPDNKYGAKPRRGFARYLWYVMDRVNGREVERSTGVEFHSPRLNGREQAEKALADYIAAKPVAKSAGPLNPAEVKIADVLTWYADGHGQNVRDGARIAYAIDALLPYWGDKTVDDITEPCRVAYRQQRQVERKDPRTGKPVVVGQIADGTARRELSTLDSACRYAVRGRRLKWYPDDQWLPPKSEPRDNWLTREKAAALLWAARREPKARYHLCLFILISLYMGLRKEAVLTLQWQPNTEGGWVDLETGLLDARPLRASRSNKRRPRAPIPNRLLRFLRYARVRTRQYVIEAERPVKQGDRTVMLPGPINDLKRSFATAAINAGLCKPVVDDDGRLITDRKGRPVLDPTVTPHSLKHTGITWLLQSGVSIWEVAGYTNTSVETIQRTYGHHSPEFMVAAKNASRGKVSGAGRTAPDRRAGDAKAKAVAQARVVAEPGQRRTS